MIANETVGGGRLRDEIRRRSEGYDEHVLVVSPALNSRFATGPPTRTVRASAQERLNASLARLREAGLDAKGEIGDGEPLQAMEDALRLFGADEIIISTHPEGRSHWLERGSSSRPASASRSRSRTWSSTSRPSRPRTTSCESVQKAAGDYFCFLMKSTSVLASASETWPFLDHRAHHARLVALHDLLVRVDDRLEQVRVVGLDGLAVRELHA